MGTRVEVVVEAVDRLVAVAASEAALDAIADTEARLSTWTDESELARLNAAPVGRWSPLSDATRREVGEAMFWSAETRGAFDVAVGALVRAWDLRGTGRIPEPGVLASARRTVGRGGLEIEAGRGRRLIGGLVVEEGGFGKGAGVRAATAAALAAGARCVRVDLGGQWASAGACEPMSLGIAHPEDRNRTVATLEWASGSVATSGHSERRLGAGGVAITHLLDPRTGRPAPDRGSVTVLAADPLAADAVATALAVMGPVDGARWVVERPQFDVVFAVPDHGSGVGLLATSSVAVAIRPAEGVRLDVLDPDTPTGRPSPPDRRAAAR